MNKKKRNRTFVISGIVLLGLIIYFRSFSRTEIVILKHLTDIHDDGVVHQICLVKNPPYFSSTLEKRIEEFDKENPVKDKYYRRLFIKEHDKAWFSEFFFEENVDYESTEITRNDLDNVDFLANSNHTLTKSGKINRNIDVNTGDLWYYKY